MGQRLVIQIEANGERLANAYYHWSAYTAYAAEMTNNIFEYLEEADSSFDNLQKAVWVLYKTGARFESLEAFRIGEQGFDLKKIEFAFDGKQVNRNDGLLCITEDGMDDNTSWEEGRVEIDIITGEVYFDVICMETVEDYLEYNCEPDDLKPDDMPVLDFAEHLEFTNKEWKEFYPKIIEFRKQNKYCLISSDKTTIYELIA